MELFTAGVLMLLCPAHDGAHPLNRNLEIEGVHYIKIDSHYMFRF